MSQAKIIDNIIERIDDVEYVGNSKNLIKLRKKKGHECLIAGREHKGNNPYIVKTYKGYYYRCHDDHCQGKEVRIRKLVEPEDYL